MPFVSTESDKPGHVYCCPEPDCGRRFNRKYTMIEHTKTHTGEKPHVCPVRTCGKRFTTSGNLSRHKRLHTTIDPLPCPVPGCLSAFASANKLEKHMKFHRGDAVQVCAIDNCGKTFSTTGNLNRHIKNHHRDHYSSVTQSESDYDVEMEQEEEEEDDDSLDSSTDMALAAESLANKDGSVCVPDANTEVMSVEYEGFYTAASALESQQVAVDALTEIFRDHIAAPDDTDVDAAASKVGSILDDVISFHVTHMSAMQ